jgi:hypothetical protein
MFDFISPLQVIIVFCVIGIFVVFGQLNQEEK